MNGEWASSIDALWRGQNLPIWLMLAALGFFGLVFLLVLLRAERTIANGALAVMTLVALGVAISSLYGGGGNGGGPAGQANSGPSAIGQVAVSHPALACIDDIAGETALAACEKLLFGAPDVVASAVAYAAAQVSRLTALGDVETAGRNMSPELQALRRAMQRDRYGLVAYVLSVRDQCQPAQCAAYGSLTDHKQIAANMDERLYESLVIKYAPGWGAPGGNAPGTAPPYAGAQAALPTTGPTGRPTNTDFPSAASIPPVNIMTPEPGSPLSAPRAPAAGMAQQTPRPSPPATPATSVASAARKQPAPKARPQAPVQLAPSGSPVAEQ